MSLSRRGKCGIALVLVVMVYVLFGFFTIEVFALAWHVRHGWTAELKSHAGKKYELKVPVLALAQVDENGSEVWITERPAPLRAYFSKPEAAIMSFSVDRAVLSAEKWRNASALAKDMEISITDVATLSVAGEELHCFERKFRSRKAAAPTNDLGMVDLTCTSRGDTKGFSASYTGTRGLVPGFFDVLKTVKRSDK